MMWIYDFFWCIISILGGGILTAILSLITNKKKQLSYKIDTYNLISKKVNNISGLEIKYNSLPIENLYSSTITIKNTGNKSIHSGDIALISPLSVNTNGKFILANDSSQIPNLSKKEYDIQLHPQIIKNSICSKILIAFDYIPSKGTISFSLFHTGDISFTGTIKDGNIINSNKNIYSSKIHLNYKIIYLYFIIAILIFFITRTHISLINYENNMNNTIQNIYQDLDKLNNNNIDTNDNIESLMEQLNNLKLYTISPGNNM